MSGFCIKGLTAVRKKSQKDQLGSFDLRPTSLNCLLQEFLRDTLLDHIWRAQKRAQIWQIKNIWARILAYQFGQVRCP